MYQKLFFRLYTYCHIQSLYKQMPLLILDIRSLYSYETPVNRLLIAPDAEINSSFGLLFPITWEQQ